MISMRRGSKPGKAKRQRDYTCILPDCDDRFHITNITEHNKSHHPNVEFVKRKSGPKPKKNTLILMRLFL